MDSARFDLVAKDFSMRASRRAALALLSALGLSGGLGLAEAKRKRKKKKKKCQGETKKCGKKCIPANSCCRDADCGPGLCGGGTCACFNGFMDCQATCVPLAECCTDADCPTGSGKTCQGGVCACPPGQQDSGGVCGVPPTCKGTGAGCVFGNECCSNLCGAVCALSLQGQPCYMTSDCVAGLTCKGFVCAA